MSGYSLRFCTSPVKENNYLWWSHMGFNNFEEYFSEYQLLEILNYKWNILYGYQSEWTVNFSLSEFSHSFWQVLWSLLIILWHVVGSLIPSLILWVCVFSFSFCAMFLKDFSNETDSIEEPQMFREKSHVLNRGEE